MLKRISLFGLVVLCVCAGCTLEDPCDIDEIYSRDDARCVKCANLPGYHLNKNNYCTLDKTEECGASMTNCMSAGVAEVSCDNGECRIGRCEEGYKVKGTLCEPCGDDEVWLNMCTKCHNVQGFHLNEDGKCVEDTTEACGVGMMDCSGIAGALEPKCIAGICVFDCDIDLGWKKEGEFCAQNKEYSCGEAEKNCMTDWRSEVYGDNQNWINATAPLCDGNKCILNMCSSGYYKLSCDEYNKYYSNMYKSLYSSGRVPGCENGITNDICIPDLCPDVANKTGDNDYDGVINCLDPCPNNSTKFDTSWWDKENGGGLRCDVRDTDHDGKDDSEDPCPTRSDIVNTDDMVKYKLCDSIDKCEKLIKDDNVDMERRCGIYIKNENEVPEYHIYNAKDFDGLRGYLEEIAELNTCVGNSDVCRYENSKWYRYKCIDGIVQKSSCKRCYNEQTGVKCDDEMNILMDTQLNVYIENDINLDDSSFETLFGYLDEHEASTEVQEEMSASLIGYGFWTSIPYLIGVDFSGKGKNQTIDDSPHVIRYYREREGIEPIRCNLMESLFGAVILSDIHDLKLDFDSKGYGHAFLANKLMTSGIHNIQMSGRLETSIADSEGVGLLIGRVDNLNVSSRRFQDKEFMIDKISVDNASIIANNADNVGGLIGSVYSTYEIYYVVHDLDLTIESIIGRNNVGGVFGVVDSNAAVNKAKIGSYGSNIKLTTNKIVGDDYVGGLIGNMIHGSFSDRSKFDLKNNEIIGNNYVGGFVGNGVVSEFIHLSLKNNIVKGNDYVGGIAGYGKFYDIIIDHHSNTVKGNDYIGGGFGFTWENHHGVIQNIVESVIGNNQVGGFAGEIFLESKLTDMAEYDHIWLYNVINSIEGVGNVGGAFGGNMAYTNEYVVCGVYNKIGMIKAREDVWGSMNINVGGLIGNALTYVSLTFSDVYNEIGTISADNIVGGLYGRLAGTDYSMSYVEFDNVYNSVGYIETKNSNVGGFGALLECIQSPCNGYGRIYINNVHSEVASLVADSNLQSGGFWGMIKISVNIIINNLSVFANVLNGVGFLGGYQEYHDQYIMEPSLNSNFFLSAYLRDNDDVRVCEKVFSEICLNSNMSYYEDYTNCADYILNLYDKSSTCDYVTHSINSDNIINEFEILNDNCKSNCDGVHGYEDCIQGCNNLWSNSSFKLGKEFVILPSLKNNILKHLYCMSKGCKDADGKDIECLFDADFLCEGASCSCE